MAKSLRSKRKKRLRTIKREISTAHYDKKHDAKMAVLDAVLAAPPPPSTSSSTMMETEQPEAPTRGRSSTKMNTDEENPADQGLYYGISLKPRGGINKRRKSRGKLKKERRNTKKQQRF